MFDLEERIGRVRNLDVRPLVDEAYRCYATGAARGCIVLTWAAVCADLIEKIYRLAEDDEGLAKAIAARIDQARNNANEVEGARIMQEVERDLLAKAEELELIDGIERRELERIRQDRHLCAHPSLRPFGTFFTPSNEYARAHLAAALDALLVHPPSQGRRAVDRFEAHVVDPLF